MKKHTKSMITIIAALIFAFGCLGSAVADTTDWGSKNKLVVKGEDGVAGTADDIVFDARDLDTIYNEVEEGRASVASALNAKGAGLYNNLPTTGVKFTDLVAGVNNQFSIPDNKLGITVNGTTDAGNESESATSFAATSDNLSLGAVAWNADGQLITGTGADNVNYVENNRTNLGLYLSYLLINGYVVGRDSSGLDKLSYEVNKVGTNINQAVHLCNINGRIGETQVKDLSDKLGMIYKIMRDFEKALT